MVEVGSRVCVESEKVGIQPRFGVVTAVDGPVVHVRWDDGHETAFVPAAGAMRTVDQNYPSSQ
ncbi:MAG: DUF1918 domain-containing protein [Acidimicrobiales bacterium]